VLQRHHQFDQCRVGRRQVELKLNGIGRVRRRAVAAPDAGDAHPRLLGQAADLLAHEQLLRLGCMEIFAVRHRFPPKNAQ
jgi:predicted nucleic acid-binding Zn ribbon protein